MARYYVIEMWEAQEIPSFSTLAGEDKAFTTNDYQEALDEQGEMQDGYILDFQECKIIKP